MPKPTRALLLVLIAACHTDPVAPDAQPVPSVAGHWLSACVPQPQADGSTLYATLELTGSDPDRWALAYTLHGDAACAAQLVTIAIHGGYELDEPSPVVPGARDARFAFDDKTITPYVQPIADALGAAHCGSAAWQLGVAQSVYAAGCATFGQYPQAQCSADYDLIDVEGATLHFGNRPADNNMCTPDRRPAELSPIGLTKQ